MNKKRKKFDSVKMTQKIRETLYEQHKDLSPEEYLKILVKESKKSSLYKGKSKVKADKL